ncbi:hypothetical protein [Lysinibacillus antri]|uniref:Uncharacterized protein n=1 Tax=Lysinibacillus antri TaxID=2498145 RepID=A0A3S0RLJ8_9BACI|nr:hypothetical protein [Lysinibacillus antri]RUL56451.1 hypothetical protein EK386_02125 [Lysinibacillus antri]
MVKKLIINNGDEIYEEMTAEESAVLQLAQEEQAFLEILRPSNEEVRKAEIEIVTTNLLIDLGVF